jgi:DNA-binding transcriptional MerR regulator
MHNAASPRRETTASAVVGIARLAQTTGVTLRALRHYESLGLIRSQRTRAGARVFTPRQCEIASTIALLRKLDVAICDIQPIIDAERPEAERMSDLRRSLERKAVDLSRRLDEVRAALAVSQAPTGN